MIEPINHNQSMNTKKISDKVTQDFFTEVHLLAGKLVLVMVPEMLVGMSSITTRMILSSSLSFYVTRKNIKIYE